MAELAEQQLMQSHDPGVALPQPLKKGSSQQIKEKAEAKLPKGFALPAASKLQRRGLKDVVTTAIGKKPTKKKGKKKGKKGDVLERQSSLQVARLCMWCHFPPCLCPPTTEIDDADNHSHSQPQPQPQPLQQQRQQQHVRLQTGNACFGLKKHPQPHAGLRHIRQPDRCVDLCVLVSLRWLSFCCPSDSSGVRTLCVRGRGWEGRRVEGEGEREVGCEVQFMVQFQ